MPQEILKGNNNNSHVSVRNNVKAQGSQGNKGSRDS